MAEKKINGRLFKVEGLIATEALKLQARLAKVLGPAVSKLPAVLAGRGEASEEAKAKSNAEAIAALTAIFSNLEPDDYAGLIKDIVQVAMIQRPSMNFDHVDLDGDFVGDQKSIYPLVFFVLETQFSDFFGGNLGNILRKAQATG